MLWPRHDYSYAHRSKSCSCSVQSCVSVPAETSTGPPPLPASGSPTARARTSCVCGRRLQLSSQRRGGAGRAKPAMMVGAASAAGEKSATCGRGEWVGEWVEVKRFFVVCVGRG